MSAGDKGRRGKEPGPQAEMAGANGGEETVSCRGGWEIIPAPRA